MRPAKTQINLGNLIRVFAVRMKKASVLNYQLSAQRRLFCKKKKKKKLPFY